MINIIPFNFNSQSVRVIADDNGDPWFVLADVCKVLALDNPTKVKSRLNEEDVQVIDLQALNTKEGSNIKDLVNAVNESGLYDVVLDSRKPEAKEFRRYVTSEVLPSIRKTGSYRIVEQFHIPKTLPEALRLAADIQEKLDQATLQIEQDKPKVRLATIISESSNARCIRVWVKTMKNDNNLCVGERDVFKYLIDKNYIFKPKGEKCYLPYSRHESTGTGFFTVIVDEINGKPRRMLKITGKGVLNLTAKVIEHFNG
jgi:anti-repressor protein